MASDFWSSTHCNTWLLPRPSIPSLLLSSPDHTSHHLPLSHLLSLHIHFTTLIHKLCRKLSLRSLAIGTASVYFKRFYTKNSFAESDPWLVLVGCVYVAAKVEECPVHVKSVLTEARACLSEHSPRPLPTDYTRLAEMEFYLLHELDFDMVVYHPYRTLAAICGRDAIDGGDWDDDVDSGEGAGNDPGGEGEGDSREGTRPTTPFTPLGLGHQTPSQTHPHPHSHSQQPQFNLNPNLNPTDLSSALNAGQRAERAVRAQMKREKEREERRVEGEGEEERVRRLGGRGRGWGCWMVDDGVFQMAWFIINDSYKTHLSLVYPPYMIALSALYLAFSLEDKSPTDPYRLKGRLLIPLPVPPASTNSAGITGVDAPIWFMPIDVGDAQTQSGSMTPGGSGAGGVGGGNKYEPVKLLTRPYVAKFFAGFNVSLPILLTIVQDIISLYPLWDSLISSRRADLTSSSSQPATPSASNNTNTHPTSAPLNSPFSSYTSMQDLANQANNLASQDPKAHLNAYKRAQALQKSQAAAQVRERMEKQLYAQAQTQLQLRGLGSTNTVELQGYTEGAGDGDGGEEDEEGGMGDGKGMKSLAGQSRVGRREPKVGRRLFVDKPLREEEIPGLLARMWKEEAMNREKGG